MNIRVSNPKPDTDEWRDLCAAVELWESDESLPFWRREQNRLAADEPFPANYPLTLQSGIYLNGERARLSESSLETAMKTVMLEKIHALSHQLAEQLSQEVILDDVDLLHLKSRIRLVERLAQRLLKRSDKSVSVREMGNCLGLTPIPISSLNEKSFAD